MDDRPTDFFVSYTAADQQWAEWIAWQLHTAGYSVIVQSWDFVPGRDFVHEMERAASTAERTIAVLSEHYRASAFGEAEWRAAFVRDPTGENGILVPVKVSPCSPPSLLASRVYIDLTDKGPADATEALLTGLRGKGARPTDEPFFPGQPAQPPMFPGDRGPRHQPLRAGPREMIQFPRGRTAIYFDGGGSVRGAAFASDLYETLQELLDDLYVNYLSNSYPPYSYGESWILFGESRCIAPIQWIGAVGFPVHESAERWQQIRPRDAGVHIDRGLHVIEPGRHEYFGVIADDERVLNVIERSEKELRAIRYRPGFPLSVEEAVEISVHEGVFGFATDELVGKVVDLRGADGDRVLRFR